VAAAAPCQRRGNDPRRPGMILTNLLYMFFAQLLMFFFDLLRSAAAA
jgi:hypothetical protein